VNRPYRQLRLSERSNRLLSQLNTHWAPPISKQSLARAARVLAPALLALTFASSAHAQGTMDFSGAQTLMGTFKTFAIYAGAIICFGGLIFAGIRMMSGRFHFTAPNKGLGIANRDLGTVEQIDPGGQLSVRMDNDKSVSFNPMEMRHFDHGYAVTSHSSQGLTADRVIVNIDTRVHPELIDSRFAYVSISRASYDAQIYTNAASSLAANLGHALTKTSAIEMSPDLGL
jgi:hypothetical protein